MILNVTLSEAADTEFILTFSPILFSMFFVMFMRPWAKIYNYINLLPLKSRERLALIALSNTSSYLIGIFIFLLVLRYFPGASNKTFGNLEFSGTSIAYGFFGLICATLSFTPYYTSSHKSIFTFQSLKWVALFIVVYVAMILLLPQHYSFHSFIVLMGTGYILSSLYEARLLKKKVIFIIGAPVFIVFFLLLIPKPSVKGLLQYKGNDIDGFYKLLAKIEDLPQKDRDESVYWLVRSDLSSYDFEIVCERFFHQKNREEIKYYFEKNNCLLPMNSMDDFKVILNSKKDLRSATSAFASFDVNSIKVDHVLLFIRNLYRRYEMFLLSEKDNDSVWRSFIHHLSEKKWSNEELIIMIKHNDLGLNLIGLSLLLDDGRWSILEEGFLPELKRIDKSPFYGDLVSNLAIKYLCQRDFVFDLNDFKKHRDICTSYAKASKIAYERRLYLGNSYFHAINVFK